MAYAIEFEGLSQLRRDLRTIDRKFGKQLGEANFRAAKVVADEAIRRAPRGAHQGGGRVAPISSTIAATRRQSAATVAIGGARSPHSVVTEFGGSIPRRGADRHAVAHARRRRRSFRSAGIAEHHLTPVRQQPYLYPAIDAKADEVMSLYGRLLGDLLREAFNR
jgi:hypothetical protein